MQNLEKDLQALLLKMGCAYRRVGTILLKNDCPPYSPFTQDELEFFSLVKKIKKIDKTFGEENTAFKTRLNLKEMLKEAISKAEWK